MHTCKRTKRIEWDQTSLSTKRHASPHWADSSRLSHSSRDIQLMACVCHEKRGNHKRPITYIYELKQTSVWYCHQQAWDPHRQKLPNQPFGFHLALNRYVHVQAPHQVTQVNLNREQKEYRTAVDCAHGPLSCTETSCRKQYHSYKITAMRSGKMILYYHSSVLHSEQGKSYFIMNDGRVPTMAYRRPEKTHILTW